MLLWQGAASSNAFIERCPKGVLSTSVLYTNGNLINNNIEREYWRARYSISSFKYRLAGKTNFGKSKKKARKRADETTTMGKKEEKHSTQESQRRPSSVFAVDTSVRDYDQRIS